MNTDLTTALQNAGYKLIDNVRYRDGKWQKRGVVWMPLAQCPALPEGYFGVVENKGGYQTVCGGRYTISNYDKRR